MSWCDLYNPGLGAGLYYGLHDPETRVAALYLELRPYSTSTVRGSNWPSPKDLPRDEPVGLTMGWLNFPYVRQASIELGPIRVEAHQGDWRAGSAIYRRWFDQHMPIPPKGWLRDQHAWQSTILLNPEDVVVHRFGDLPGMAADARRYDVSLFEICGWDVGGIDRAFPDYRPDPRLGSRREFRAALAGIRAADVKPVVFANLQVADTATKAYREELHDYTLQGRWADDLRLLGFGEGTMGARMGLARSNMAILSLSHPKLRASLVAQMADLVRDGAAALQLDKTVVIQYLDFNARVPTSPDRSLPVGLLHAFQEILEAGRQIDPEFALASEIWWDPTFPYVDVLYTRMVDIDIPHPSLLYTFPEVACDLCGEPDRFQRDEQRHALRHGVGAGSAPLHGVARRTLDPAACSLRQGTDPHSLAVRGPALPRAVRRRGWGHHQTAPGPPPLRVPFAGSRRCQASLCHRQLREPRSLDGG